MALTAHHGISRFFRTAARVIVACVLQVFAGAATLTWTGAGNNDNVPTAGNWSPGQAPVAGDDLVFSGGTRLTPRLVANLAVSSLSFGTTAQAFVLGGVGVYTVNAGGITNNSTSAQRIDNGIQLGANQTWNAAAGALTVGGAVNLQTFSLTTSGANAITISGVISGTGSVTKNGTGTLQLGGAAANTYTGLTTVNSGVLELNKSAGVLAVAGNLTIGDGAGGGKSDVVKLLANGQIAATATVLINGSSGLLDLNGFTQTIGSLADAGTVTTGGSGVNLGAGTLTVGDTASSTFSGAITGAGGSLVKQGSGTLTLAGTNTYSGTTTVSAGTLRLNASAAFPAAGNLVMFGGSFDINGQSPVVGSITFGNGTATTAASITDSGAVRGAITLTGGIAYNGTSGFTFPPGLISAKVELSPGIHSVTNPNGVYSSSTNYDVVLSGVISGAGGLAKDGPSNSFWIALNAQNTYTGVTNVNAGNLYLGVTNSVPQFSAVTVGSGASLILNPPVTQFGVTAGSYSQRIGSLAGAGAVTLGSATLTSGNDGTSTVFSGVISGTGGFSKVGDGAQTFRGINTYTGATTVNQGTLNLDYTAVSSRLADTSVLVLGGGTVNLQNGASAHTEIVASTTLIDGASTVSRSSGTSILRMNTITRTTGGTVNFTASGIAQTDNTNNAGGFLGAWATVGGNDWAVNSTNGNDGLITAFSSYANLTRLSSGTKVIPNTSTANVRIIEGTGAAANITLAAATTAIYSLNQSTIGGAGAATVDVGIGRTLRTNAILVGSGAGTLTIGSGTGAALGTLTTATAGGELTLLNFSGNPLSVRSVVANNTSASSLTNSGTGITVLANANTYTGATTVSGGTLSVGTIGNGGVAGNIGAATNAAANLVLGGGTLRYTGVSASTDRNFTLTPTTSSSIEVTQAGTVLTISGASTNTTGALTKLGAGMLQLMGANLHTGATTVNAGTLEAGAADALKSTSAITVNSGGTLLLSGSGNRVNDSASFTLAGGTLGVTGSNVSENLGALILSGSSVIDFGTGNANTLTFASLASFSGTLRVLNWSGTVYGPAETTDHGPAAQDRLVFGTAPALSAAQLAAISFYGDSGNFIGTGAQVRFIVAGDEIVPVPEPATILGALALVGLVGIRERRRLVAVLARVRCSTVRLG